MAAPVQIPDYPVRVESSLHLLPPQTANEVGRAEEVDLEGELVVAWWCNNVGPKIVFLRSAMDCEILILWKSVIERHSYIIDILRRDVAGARAENSCCGECHLGHNEEGKDLHFEWREDEFETSL